MKKVLLPLLFSALLWSACSKSDTPAPIYTGNNIVTIDSSEFNGHLFVYTYDYVSASKIPGTDVYLYINYDDIKRRLFLLYQKSNSSAAEADFGYLLQGNYYVISNTAFKSDTSLVQVLGKRIVKRNVYLK